MSNAAIIDIASLVHGLGANALVCEQAPFATGGAVGFAIPALGAASPVALAQTATGAHAGAVDVAPIGGAASVEVDGTIVTLGAPSAFLAGASGRDTLAATARFATGQAEPVHAVRHTGHGAEGLDRLAALRLSSVGLGVLPAAPRAEAKAPVAFRSALQHVGAGRA